MTKWPENKLQCNVAFPIISLYIDFNAKDNTIKLASTQPAKNIVLT